MNSVAPTNLPAFRAKAHRTKILLSVMLIMAVVLGWEYWILRLHRTSLERLQGELERRKTLQVPLKRSDVTSFLSGSPRNRSESEGIEGTTDYYTWRGLLHHSHIKVEVDANGEIMSVENSLFGGTEFQQRDEAPKFRASTIPPETVAAALQKAEEVMQRPSVSQFLLSYPYSYNSQEFPLTLVSVFDALPELKVSTVRGKIHWNSIRIPRDGRRLFAFRFRVPFSDPVELDYVRMVQADRVGIFARSEPGVGYRNDEAFAEGSRLDVEQDVDVAGFRRLEFAQFGSRSLNADFPAKEFILWFDIGENDSRSDFELKTVLFVSKADQAPLRCGLHEVCDYIGLNTNVPKFAATPDGIHDAINAFDQRLQNGSVLSATAGRIFRSLMPALPEFRVNNMAGQADWQKLEFPNGSSTAVRIQIPTSFGDKADLYGALLSTQPVRFGWDYSDPYGRPIESRTLLNMETESPLPSSPNQLTLFSHSEGVLKPGQEVVLWFQQPSYGKRLEPAFLTLTALPHGATGRARKTPSITAQQAWACGKLLGVTVLRPASSEAFSVLGMHEREIDFLKFTPDGHRLISIDDGGHVNVWSVESRELEGQITRPPISNFLPEMACLSPDSKMLLIIEPESGSILRWNLDSREPASTLKGLASEKEKLLALAFGPQPQQLTVVIDEDDDYQLRLATRDLMTGQTINHSETVWGTTAAIVYMPTQNMFALGLTQANYAQPGERIGATPVASIDAEIEFFSGDFANRIQQLSFGEEPGRFVSQEMVPLRLAYQPNGRRLAAIGEMGRLKVWDVVTGTELLSTTLQFEPVKKGGIVWTPQLNLSLSADGETVAAGSPSNAAVSVWNISDGQYRQMWQADDVPVTHVAHSPDGKWVATANTDGVIRLWQNAKE